MGTWLPVAGARFLAAQLHELAYQSAAIHGDSHVPKAVSCFTAVRAVEGGSSCCPTRNVRFRTDGQPH